ncbi:Starch-binding associating with outer membrane [Salinimicrobium catena]|uniref:Starch-binding associating with outer membrane n=1 Tax=Salinimicrobium catena TaxID=390640 RepID=A0A1H5MT14_9FLAO|nr:RagB/SusD family nutrient uptake outer membrane protein [Salinimicrobium catena]SDL28019.1 Starch-binding associating with outer membrane [Salinimicrobium catena]SEE91791.1 Starch-binding associating with outer membrane [Salinimicrobium catena]
MKFKIASFLFSGIFLFTSCTALDEELYDKVQDTDFGQTPSEVEALVGGAYSSLRGFKDDISTSYPTSEYVFFLNEVVSDEATIPTRGTDWYDGGQYQEAQRHTWDADNGMILSAWRYSYTGIAKINSIIYQIDQSGLSEEAQTPIKAELRAVRAYYYYLLLDMFGNVPIVTDFEDQELPANSSRQEVFDFVETELLESIPHLSSEIAYSKFTQNVAYALLARLYLNSEAFVGVPRWQDCIDACRNITGYTLEPDYFANFATENQNSNEIILAIPYDSDAGTLGNYLNSMSAHYLHRFTISPIGDYPWSANGISGQPGAYSAFEDHDVRKKSFLEGEQIHLGTGSVLIMDNGEPLVYTEEIGNFTNAQQNEGVRLNKYEQKAGETWERDHDWVVIRYAEVLMMQAESYVRMGSPDLARPFIDQITARAGTETPATIDLDYLNNELLREFIFEGKRRTDNIRFGTFFQPWWEKGATPEYRAIFPIPQVELDKNTNLVQNPGY